MISISFFTNFKKNPEKNLFVLSELLLYIGNEFITKLKS
jgi:hypothetical protein